MQNQKEEEDLEFDNPSYRYIYILLYSYIIMVIQIQISDEVWKYLNKDKRPGETFNDVLKRRLKIKEEKKK